MRLRPGPVREAGGGRQRLSPPKPKPTCSVWLSVPAYGDGVPKTPSDPPNLEADMKGKQVLQVI